MYDWSTIAFLRQRLLAETPRLTLQDMVDRSGQPVEKVRQFWVVMGFPPPALDEPIFTEQDLLVFMNWRERIESKIVAEDTAISLVRAVSHLTDRMALWQVEALVQDVATRYGLDDTTARIVLLDRIESSINDLEAMLLYSWRRQMESLLSRVESEVALQGIQDAKELPLVRTVGFVDMVSFTSTSAELSGSQLVALIESFEASSRNAVTRAGGRVVKTIGDAVLFIADDLATGVKVVFSVLDALGKKEELLPVRASVVQGQVVSRSGDVFGPVVNLASRLADRAPRGQVYTDEPTAKAILESDWADKYNIELQGKLALRGFGDVDAWKVEPAEN